MFVRYYSKQIVYNYLVVYSYLMNYRLKINEFIILIKYIFYGNLLGDQQMTAERPETFSIQSFDGICTKSVNSTSSFGPGK